MKLPEFIVSECYTYVDSQIHDLRKKHGVEKYGDSLSEIERLQLQVLLESIPKQLQDQDMEKTISTKVQKLTIQIEESGKILFHLFAIRQIATHYISSRHGRSSAL